MKQTNKTSRLSLLALEPRWVFDGAGATELQDLNAAHEAAVIFAQAATAVSPARLVEGQKDAQRLISQWMQQGDAVKKLSVLFGGDAPQSDWLDRAQALVDSFERGELNVRLELRSSAEMLGSWGAFAQQGPDGQPVIYVNADWLASSSTDAQSVSRVLAEEWGHFLDAQLNQTVDTAGDEGEAFAATVLGLELTEAQWAGIRSENDTVVLNLDGAEVQVELASLLFTNTAAYWIGIDTNGVNKTTLESNIVYTKSSVGVTGDRYLFVSVPESDPVFSGNNTRGWLYVVGTDNKVKQAYVGEISRLYKDGSRITGLQFYLYPGATYNENYMADRQTVSDSILIDVGAGFRVGQTYGTSSDPVSAALNSMLVPAPLVASADAATALEAGGVANATVGINPTGNILSNDTGGVINYSVNKTASATDPTQWVMVQSTSALAVNRIDSVLAATTASVTASGNTVHQGLYGTLTISVTGAYSYAVNNSLAAVQALRGTTNTLVDTFNYTMGTGAAQAVGVFNLTIQGANDAPVAKDDYNVAKESITDGLVGGATAYTAMNAGNTVGDRLGQTAVGNVLPNDTDVDAFSETKSITGSSLDGAATGSTSGVSTLSLSNTPSSLSSLPAASYPVYRQVGGVYQPVYETNGSTIANFTKSGSGSGLTFSISDAKNVAVNDVLYVQRNATTYELVGTVSTITPPSSTSIKLSGFTGNVAVGMTVTGTGVTTGTTVSSVTYDASGNVTGVVLSQAFSMSNVALTFNATTAPGASMTGQYGTLVLNADGSYVYTPFANNVNLSSGDLKVDAFKYTMRDAAGLTSTATLYINVQGSGVNDPNAIADTVTAVEAGGTANGTAGTDPVGTGVTGLLGNDTTPAGTGSITVGLVKTAQTAPDQATALTGSIVNNGVTYAAKVTGLYGDLYVKTDGTYRYVVDNTNATVQALRLSTDRLQEVFQYRIGNGSGFDWSSLTVTIDGANDAPVARNDGLIAQVGQYVPVGNVLTNDSDVDAGDTKAVTKIVLGSTLPGTNNVTASTSSTTGYTEMAGTYGKLRIGSDGSYTYLVDSTHPDILALGTGQRLANPDVFTYQMRDTAGLLSSATLTMAVEGRNDAPVNTLPATFTAQEGGSYPFSGALSASDVDLNLSNVTLSVLNGTLAVSETGATPYRQSGNAADPQDGLLLAGGAIMYFDANGVTGNGGKTFTLYGTQDQINAALASLVYTPNAGSTYVASDTLTMVSKDDEGLSDTDTVAIAVAAPALAVTGTTVNEASPYTLFSVTGKEGQSLKLLLEATGTGASHAILGTDTGTTLQYFNPTNSTWVTYNPATNGGFITMPNDGDATAGETATLLVRVANVNDTAYEAAETIRLVATNAGSVAANGVSIIKDDGTGDIFLAGNNSSTPNPSTDAGYPAQLDDDRPLTVSSVTVNEGSPYAVFTVSGAAGQLATLALANQNADGANLSTLQYFNGTSWVTYTSGTVALDGAGKLLVRVALSPEQDAPVDGPETFNLLATNTGGSTPGSGLGTIVDDGTGSYFAADNNTANSNVPAGVLLDDDRPLAVTNLTVNEGSPYAVFTVSGVTGSSGQLLSLALANQNGDGNDLATLEYFNGSAWVSYTSGTVALDSTGKLLVRVALSPEQEQAQDSGETFKLVATNASGLVSTGGTGTIVDDGTGDYFAANNLTGTPALPTGVLLDDDRPLAVNSFTVNEGSPYAVFTVTGAANQLSTLTLANGTTTGLSGLQYYNGSAWVSYTGTAVALDGAGKLLVRTALSPEQELALDGGETFTLTATNTGLRATTGTATVQDDGTGNYYAGDNTNGTSTVPSGVLLDDDRPLTINNLSVNEASPYAVFTVTGATGQAVRLSLPGGAANPATDPTGGTAALGTTLPTLQYLVGSTWTNYDAANPPVITGGTTLLVRVSIAAEQDTPYDGPETFTLQAANTGTSAVIGTATIKDDGTGDYFAENDNDGTSTLPGGVLLDDDRPLAVNSLTVNEGSPFVVFSVTGAANQTVASLALANGTTTGITGLEYFNGTSWVSYSTGTLTLNSSGALLVRTALNPEQETPLDTGETFTLTATNTGTGAATGTATVKDDGTGSYFAPDNNTGSSSLPSGTLLDDDRVLDVSNLTVNEGSPYAVFTVTGAPGQVASLSLASQNGDGNNLATLQYFNGAAWVSYTSGTVALDSTTGKLLVRVALAPEQETALDGPETFKLVATNSGGTVSTNGLGTIVDDGTGSYFAPDNNTATPALPNGILLDDDRLLAVNNLTVNEGSPYAVFTVTGAANQLANLALSNGSTTGLAGLQYLNGSTWTTYTGAAVALDGTGKLLVRTALTPEQEAALDTNETFTLTATNTGGTAAVGTATVKDDGTGDYFAGNNTTGTDNLPSGTLLDDDRPLAVNNVTVSEAVVGGKAVFTITGLAGQYVKLGLASTGSGAGDAVLSGTGADLAAATTLEYNDGTGWVTYNASNPPKIAAGATTLQARVAVNRDALVETDETFFLTATTTGGSVARGTGTITDYAPALPAVTGDATEAGGTNNSFGSANATGDLVSDASMSLVSVASQGAGTSTNSNAATNVTVVGLYGTLTFNATGTWTYRADNTNASVEALRLTTNTLVDTFSYTVEDAFGARSTSTVAVTIKGNNDAPVAAPDTNTAKESLIADGDATQYSNTDLLGQKALGNVLTNDTDVDAGDGKTISSVNGTATASTITNNASTNKLEFVVGTTFSPVGSNDEAWYWLDANSDGQKDAGEWRAVFTAVTGGSQVTAAGDYDNATRTLPMSATPAYYYDAGGRVAISGLTNATFGFKNSSSITTETTGGMKQGVVQGSQTSGTSSIALSAFTGTVAVGMTVTGAGVSADTTVSSVTYNASGSPTSVTLSKTVTATAGASLTFQATAGTRVTGLYGSLVLQADGGYVYTPVAINSAISEGESKQEVFNYTVADTAGLTHKSTLTITVLGSGVNDPNAQADTQNVTEAVDSLAATLTASANLLTNDTTPADTGPLTVANAKSSSSSNFSPVTSGTQIQGLYGKLILSSDGSYTYSLDNTLAAVQALNAGDSLTEQFQYEVRNGKNAVASPFPALKDVTTLTITINGANDSPTLDLNLSTTGADHSANFTEGGAAVSLLNAAGLNVTDVDSNIFNKVTVSLLQASFADSSEQLVVNGATTSTTAGSPAMTPLTLGTLANGATGTFAIGTTAYSYTVAVSSGTVTLDIKGSAGGTLTKAQVETVLDALRYQNTSEDPNGTRSRVFNLAVTDAGGLVSNTAVSTITVTPVNDAPLLDLDADDSTTATVADYKGSFKVGTAASAIADIDTAVTDVDSATMASATIVLTNAKVGDSLSILGSLPAGITATVPAVATADGTLTLTLTGVATQAAYETALEALRFAATGTDYTNRELTVVVSDGSAVTNTANSILAVLPDDRALTVTGTRVNEASPYVLFSVAGADGQRVSLELASTGTGPGFARFNLDTSNAGSGVPLQYLNSSNQWVTYTPGAVVTISGTSLLVRTGVVNDGLNEGAETLALKAQNDAGATASGTSTIVDDGTGDIFLDGNKTPTPSVPADPGYPAQLDDDRPLAVNSVTVNEGSPYAVFTVTGAANQLATLGLADQNNDGANLVTLQYNNGSGWVNYTGGTVPLNSSGQVLVRVAINPEQETALDGPETFKLVATNTGGGAAAGSGTIVDDGTGDYFADDNPGNTPAVPPGVVLDDDRLLSVNNLTVNEASPQAVFTVAGAAGQNVTLALTNGTTTGITGLAYFNGSTWVNYTGGTVALDAGGKLLVRTALSPEQEAALDTGETFTLKATNAGGSFAVGTATVKDDGTGDYFATDNNSGNPSLPPGTLLDDDRALTVNSVTVNEASPYAVFKVTGATGQAVLLSLPGGPADPTADTAGGTAALGATLPALEYFESGQWKSYDASNPPRIASGATTLLVRVAITAEQEKALDGPETFSLQAANTGGGTASGVATIVDDGTGSYFGPDNNTGDNLLPPGTVLDDDRLLTVTSVTVNEGSPQVVFTVSGAANQLATLTLANGTTTGVSGLAYFNGTAWVNYTGGTVALDANGKLLVRTALAPEQEALLDTGETFTLTAANTGATAATGTATVMDDGTGDYFANDNNSATPRIPGGVLLDDDRALSVNNVSVNEGSPYAVFKVTGASGQVVQLSLPGGPANPATDDAGDDAALGTPLPPLQYLEGGVWKTYDPANPPKIATGATTLLVRVAISAEQEVQPDGPETFSLQARNTGGTAAVGTATIRDDGTGDYFDEDNTSGTSTLPAGTLLDDDRLAAVNSIVVNEGSPKAVFTVTAAAGQYLQLSLTDGTAVASADGQPNVDGSADYVQTLEIYQGGSWVAYVPGSFVQVPANGALLVRTPVLNDDAYERSEAFSLTATNTGGGAASGTGTIVDDGTGQYWLADNIAPATPTELAAANVVLDDDRAIVVRGGTYNEGSPRAIFQVDASNGQLLTLAVEDVDTTGLATTPLYYSVNGGQSWSRYAGTPFVSGSVPVLVAVDITPEADEPLEVIEELRLRVNQGLVSEAAGSSFITDTGQDNIAPFIDALSVDVPDPLVDLGGDKDNDIPIVLLPPRVLGVSSPIVKEGDGFAVFTITGSSGQAATLALSDGTATAADYGTLQYSIDGGATWQPYSGGQVQLSADGEMLVRVPVTQDSLVENSETFTLTATNANSVTTDGVGTILDDDVLPAPPVPVVAAPPLAAPAPAPRVTAASVHVEVAVAEARGQGVQVGGVTSPQAAAQPAGNQTRNAGQALDQMIESYDRGLDPSLYVLPAVRQSRADGSEASKPTLQFQSGLLWDMFSSATTPFGPVAQAPTLADQTLADLSDTDAASGTAVAGPDVERAEGEGGDAAAQRIAQLAAWRVALAQDAEPVPSGKAAKPGFSSQLKGSAQQPLWMQARPPARSA